MQANQLNMISGIRYFVGVSICPFLFCSCVVFSTCHDKLSADSWGHAARHFARLVNVNQNLTNISI